MDPSTPNFASFTLIPELAFVWSNLGSVVLIPTSPSDLMRSLSALWVANICSVALYPNGCKAEPTLLIASIQLLSDYTLNPKDINEVYVKYNIEKKIIKFEKYPQSIPKKWKTFIN